MLSSLGSFFGDGRALPVLATAIAVIVIAGLAFWVYRLAFATRLRPPGAARGRAPRLGVVDVFGLDGQRQLVIVRRDNVEHLLLLGGPNDIVVEPNISRSASNGRDAAKAGATSEPEPVAPIPAPAAPAPRPAAILRRETPSRSAPTDSPPPVDPVVVLAETRPRPAPTPRPATEPPREAQRSEPVKLESVRPEPVRPETVKPVLPPESPKPNVAAEAVKPTEPSVKPVDPEPAKAAPETARRPVATPRPTLASARPSLPPPITPLRPRSGTEPTPEATAITAPAGEIVTLKPAEPVVSPPPVKPVNVPPSIKPDVEASQSVAKPKKEDTFYDLESLEAEMARLLGRDP